MAMLLGTDKWWVFVMRGLLAIAFGVFTIVLPSMALLTLILGFGIYAVAEGVANIGAALGNKRREEERWWVFLVSGIASVVAGFIALVWPGITTLALLFLIAARAFVTGVLEIVAAARLRKAIRGEWMLVASGILSIVFGVLIAVFPGLGALGILMWIGAYALFFGALLVGLGLRLRRLRGRTVGWPPSLTPVRG